MTRIQTGAKIRQWLAEPLKPEVEAALERLAREEDIAHIAIMPDVHLSRDVCIGAVVASRSRIYPQAVGGDIGCGMAAIRFNCEAGILGAERAAARVLAGLYERVPANRHGRRTLREALPEPLQSSPLSGARLEKLKSRDGRVQFATLGSGNHFLEFQVDAEGWLWLMVHSGSRALGQAITGHHLEAAHDGDTGLKFLDAGGLAGQAYLRDCAWACEYAARSRRGMVDEVLALLERIFSVTADQESYFTCHHNFVSLESHFGADFWVHRKGALSARQGEPGIIPGSMGSESFHVEGRGCAEALQSSSHGAGRSLSRAEARRRIKLGCFRRQMQGIWFDHRLENRLLEESPSAYKDIHAVLAAQKSLTRIVRRVRPVLCYKGI
ncbi:MAG: RtcB family protein [Planctomycetes bacterium]|nr:RtcB family protein [Planctomycetota bacterium]